VAVTLSSFKKKKKPSLKRKGKQRLKIALKLRNN
jgi:hypothetical protein